MHVAHVQGQPAIMPRPMGLFFDNLAGTKLHWTIVTLILVKKIDSWKPLLLTIIIRGGRTRHAAFGQGSYQAPSGWQRHMGLPYVDVEFQSQG